MGLSKQLKPYLRRLLFNTTDTATRLDMLVATVTISLVLFIGFQVVMLLAVVGYELGIYTLPTGSSEEPIMSGVVIAMMIAYVLWIARLILHLPIVRKRLLGLQRSSHLTLLWMTGCIFVIFPLVMLALFLLLANKPLAPHTTVGTKENSPEVL